MKSYYHDGVAVAGLQVGFDYKSKVSSRLQSQAIGYNSV